MAITKGWRPVVDTFAQTAAIGTKTALEELREIPSGRNTNIADDLTFKIRNPKELGSADEGLLQAYAEDDTSTVDRLTKSDRSTVTLDLMG